MRSAAIALARPFVCSTADSGGIAGGNGSCPRNDGLTDASPAVLAQSALRLKSRLLFQPAVMVTSVPYQLESADHDTAASTTPPA